MSSRRKGLTSVDTFFIIYSSNLFIVVIFIELTDDDIIAQALVFFFAGFETSSSTLTFGLMEIARFPQVQQKARENIEQVLARHNGVMSYQALQEMTYLELIMQGKTLIFILIINISNNI